LHESRATGKSKDLCCGSTSQLMRAFAETAMQRRQSVAMPSRNSRAPVPQFRIRRAKPDDLDALIGLEQRVFATDRLSRRSLQRLLRSRSAEVFVAVGDEQLAGVAIVLFRARSLIARLYSLAVAPHAGGRGLASMMLDAAERAALERGCRSMRLEVHEANHAAISRYRKSGYREFGRRRAYYQDRGDALRFEKRLIANPAALRGAPPYFHQTTDFTCGPACMMMALAWADRRFKPAAAFEFQLWREATTIWSGTGPGGCEPFGMAVTLRRHGLWPEIYVSRRGSYFLDEVKSADKRRVMQLAQAEFQREARAFNIPIHMTPVNESVLMRALDAGKVAIVLVSGYHMIPRGMPHWIFAFGRNGRHMLVHDPAAIRDEKGMAAAAESYAVPWAAFERVLHVGRGRLSAAIVIRKGPS
jgi:ribosomal protein S18 acetylase RimI-like enzyme